MQKIADCLLDAWVIGVFATFILQLGNVVIDFMKRLLNATPAELGTTIREYPNVLLGFMAA